MKYQRTFMDPGAFRDILPDGAKLHWGLDLPVFKFEKDKTKYEFTDLRPLNETAIYVLEQILSNIAADPEISACEFVVGDDVDDDLVDLVSDIITSIKYEARKVGKNGWGIDGHLFTSGIEMIKSSDGKRTLRFRLITDHVKTIHDCIIRDGMANMARIVVAVADFDLHRFDEALDRPGTKGR